jgi:16S rRNA processing protein RimM
MAPAAAPPGALPGANSDELPADAVEVGRIIGAWGVQGGLKIKPFAADPQALFSSKRWYLQPNDLPRPPGAKAAQPLPALLRVKQARDHGDGVVATVHDIDDRDAAQALAGARIFVPRTSFPTPDDGEFYWVDLIGLQVANRQGLALGRVVGLIETGPHCVLRIQPEAADADERLIPFVDAYVDQVDVPGGSILVDWEADY